MALLGKGLLVIWNGISDAGELDFVRWHVGEHIPERVGLPGFLRGRRYVAHAGHPRYFNFYETETPETLSSSAYQARLNDPTPWTQRVVKEFKDTSRTACEVKASIGRGEGAWIETVRLAGLGDSAEIKLAALSKLRELAALDGIVGVHLARAVAQAPSQPTAEMKLRGQADARSEWVLLIEAAELEFLTNARYAAHVEDLIKGSLGAASAERGVYRLQYALTHSELGAADALWRA